MARRGSEYHNHGTYFTVSFDGHLERCVSCGRPIEHVKLSDGTCGLANHRCPDSHDNIRAAKDRSDYDSRSENETPEGRRLYDGLLMMQLHEME